MNIIKIILHFSRNYLHLFFCLLFLQAFAQPRVTWDKTYGGSNNEALTTASTTADGGYLLCGVASSQKGFDVSELSRDKPDSLVGDYWIVKTDSLGNKILDKRFGGIGNDICWKVIQNDAGYLLIGQSDSNKSGDKSENPSGIARSNFL